MLSKFAVLFVLLMAASASAQEPRTTNTAWPENARPIADYVSSGLVAATVIAEEVHQYKDYGWKGVGCSALVFAATNLETFALKNVIHEERPNGVDNHSAPSGHTANAFSVGWQSNIAVPIGIGVGYLRTAANWHYWWDVMFGAALGTMNRFLVGLIPVCSELSP